MITPRIKDGTHHTLRERDVTRARGKSTPHRDSTHKLCGAIYTRNTVIRPTGATIILTVLVAPLPGMMDYGARLATALDIHPTPATLLPSAFLPKAKVMESDRVMETATGKAKTFLRIITLTKLYQLCMMPLLLLLLRIGGQMLS